MGPSMMLHVPVVVLTVPIREKEWEMLMRVEYVILLRQMAVVYRYLRYFIQMNVFMTASIVLTESQMMFQEPVLHPMKFVSLPWNFIDAIILKDYF